MVTYGVSLFLTVQKTVRRKENNQVEFSLSTWIFFGIYDENYYLVANVQNFTTRYIYHQYYVVFDDSFQKVVGTG